MVIQACAFQEKHETSGGLSAPPSGQVKLRFRYDLQIIEKTRKRKEYALIV